MQRYWIGALVCIGIGALAAACGTTNGTSPGSGVGGVTTATTGGTASSTTGGTTAATTAGATTAATTAGATTAATTAGGTTSATAGGTTTGTTTGVVTRATISAKSDPASPTGFSFDSPITVKTGTIVTWMNTSAAPHSIVWDLPQTPQSSPPPGSNLPVFSPGNTSASWTAPTVTTTTTYNYHCGIHGPSMAGVIIVTP